MPIDQALVGSLLTGALALASQIVAKSRCYVACKRDADGEYCEPTCQAGFMDTSLAAMEKTTVEEKDDDAPRA